MDFKSALQESLQASGRPQASYVLVKEAGPEHSKTFTVEAGCIRLPDTGKAEFTGRAEGSTKKKAEQDAARQVLEHLLRRQPRPTPKRREIGAASTPVPMTTSSNRARTPRTG